jgi:predicted DNA-binding transcriptional regulator AlpA
MVEEDYWTIRQVAEFLGITESSVRVYLAKGNMPAPDQKYGVTNLWKPETIKAWHESRPHARKDPDQVDT